jgi:hypothetical protein
MAQEPEAQAQPETRAVLAGAATQPQLVGRVELSAERNEAECGEGRLQDVLPDVSEVAKKVGGYKRLAEIADALGQMGE